jgi:hypothetical protein
MLEKDTGNARSPEKGEIAMNWIKGGTTVPRGVYFNAKMWEFVQFEKDEPPVLPGDENARYVKVPAALTLLAGPLGGLVFVIFLPLVGIVGLVSFLIYKAAKIVTGGASRPPSVRGRQDKSYLHPADGAPKAGSEVEVRTR